MILAVRHPRPAIDAGVCYGQLDVALAEPVLQATDALLQRISAERFARVVTSPLLRARGLAEAIAAKLNLEMSMEPRLQELGFGAWEGVAWVAVPRDELDAWARDPLGYRPGGGETAGELADRVAHAWRDATASGERQLWITHAGPMRCLYAISRGLPLEQCLDRRFDYGDVLDLRTPA